MSGLVDSLMEWAGKRTWSSATATFFFFCAVIKWEGWHTLLFTSERYIHDKYGLLKNEYLHQYFFGWHGWNTLSEYLWAAILTSVYIFLLPKYILIPIYIREQRDKMKRRIIKLELKREEESEEARLATETKNAFVAKVGAAEAIKKASRNTPEVVWEEEFRRLAGSPIFGQFNTLINSVYNHSSQIRDGYDQMLREYDFQIPQDILIYADTNGLITLADQGDTFVLTQKGRYFIKLFFEYNNVLGDMGPDTLTDDES